MSWQGHFKELFKVMSFNKVNSMELIYYRAITVRLSIIKYPNAKQESEFKIVDKSLKSLNLNSLNLLNYKMLNCIKYTQLFFLLNGQE